MGINQQNYCVIYNGFFLSAFDLKRKASRTMSVNGTYKREHQSALIMSKMDALMLAGTINEQKGNMEHCIIEASFAEQWAREHLQVQH